MRAFFTTLLLALSLPAIALTRDHLPSAAPALQEIRLSHGAKTAIIVTAIVVGVLIVVGVVFVAAPDHPPH